MIIKYKPLIISIELLSNIILISINKKNNIYYKEIIKEKNIEKLPTLLNDITKKNYLNFKNIDLITLNFIMQHYTNSKVISAVMQGISLSMKLPIIKISTSHTLALNLSKIEKNKYIIINDENYINTFEIYVNNSNDKINLISNEIIYKKNYDILKKNVITIRKSLNIFKKSKILPNIYTYIFIKNKKMFNKFSLPNKVIPHFKNKNFYSYYTE